MPSVSHERVIRIQNNDLAWEPSSEKDGLVQCLPSNLGTGQTRLFQLADNFSYLETHFHPQHELVIVNRISDQQPRLVLTLGLQGSSLFSAENGDEAVFRSGYSTVTTFNSAEGSRSYQAMQAVSQLRFSVTKSWLEQQFGAGALDACFKKRQMQLISHRPSSSTSMLAAQALLTSNLAVKAQPLFRAGQAMTILASELEHLFSSERSGQLLSKKDRHLADLAKEILYTEYRTPPTITELCTRLATNPCKLKQVFRLYFETTPYGMLLDIRMKHAYAMLQSNRFSVAMVAEAVGYNHASNFSIAFSKYFSFSPGNCKKRS